MYFFLDVREQKEVIVAQISAVRRITHYKALVWADVWELALSLWTMVRLLLLVTDDEA